MGIGIRNLSASDAVESEAYDLAAAVRQVAAGLLGTTVQLADLVRCVRSYRALRRGVHVLNGSHQVIPFVAGGFMYIGAVAVLPTYVSFGLGLEQMAEWSLFGRLLEESSSGKQALREVSAWACSISTSRPTNSITQFAAMAFGVLCMFLVAYVFYVRTGGGGWRH